MLCVCVYIYISWIITTYILESRTDTDIWNIPDVSFSPKELKTKLQERKESSYLASNYWSPESLDS